MHEIRTYNDPKKFWVEVSPHLKKEEAKNSLCLGLSYLFQTNPSDCVYQSALFQGGVLRGSVVVSKHRANINFLPSPTSDPEIAKTLFVEFQKTNTPVTGMVSEKATADIYKGLFERLGKSAKLNMAQGIYRCDSVKVPESNSDLIFRLADVDDLEEVGHWIEELQCEAVPHDPRVLGAELARPKIDNKMIYVVEKNGALVSMAAWSKDIETSCSVNLVFTPKVRRKNGYASFVTAKLTQQLLENGKRETNLYTDMKNPTSNKIYMDIGYEFVCDSVHYGLISD